MKYASRLKRKQFVLETSEKAKRYYKKSVKKLGEIVESTHTLDTIIYKQIKDGLDYNFTPKYYCFNNSIYLPSIESEYNQYHNSTTDKKTYEEIFNVLVNVLLPNRLSKYTDLELVVGTDEFGKYFEVKLANN